MTLKRKITNILNNRLLRHLGAAIVPVNTCLQEISPSLAEPVSQLVTAEQIRSPHFHRLRMKLGMKPGLNRKLWEYVYILRVLECHLQCDAEPTVLGFGVGRERLPAVLAGMGCRVTATDLPCEKTDKTASWTASSLQDLQQPMDDDWDPALRDTALCPAEEFDRLVDFKAVDMNNIPASLAGFDAVWSCGALEHIGGLQHGLDFIKASMSCLKPGGIAVHTTEFNFSSDQYTYDSPELSFYRKSDLLALAAQLQAAGHEISFNFHRENTPENNHLDQSPFHYACTMNALLGEFVVTSIGIIVKKKM